MKNEVKTDIDKEAEDAVKDLLGNSNILMLYNDDHNTFDFVIDCLLAYCGHTIDQATQCTMLVHYKGKCDIKRGSYDTLEPICTALLKSGLKAKIE
jgi:ATP-dependent Clp protease adaptor protein ClpS